MSVNEEKTRKKTRKWYKIPLVLLTAFVVLMIIGLAILPNFIMKDIMYGKFAQTLYDPADFGVTAQTLQLTTEDDLKIEAYLTEAKQPKGTVILISGIHNPSVTAFFGYAKMLNDHGWSALLVEMRAHGNSEGEQICFAMKEWMDVKAGVEYLKQSSTYGELPIVVWGTSMGGSTAINAMGEMDEIDGLISCSAFSSWPDIFKEYMQQSGVPGIFATLETPFINLYLGTKIGFQYLDISAVNEIKKLDGRPALLMHSTGDTQVPYANYERIMAAKKQEVSAFTREGDYHFITYDETFGHPEKDTEFCNTVFEFLDENFESLGDRIK